MRPAKNVWHWWKTGLGAKRPPRRVLTDAVEKVGGKPPSRNN
jgi:hypothetical protein